MTEKADETERKQSTLFEAGLCRASTELAVEMGTVKLTLEELIGLHEGQILEFCFNSDDAVTLTLGDQELASARLVSQGDELMLQIEKVLR